MAKDPAFLFYPNDFDAATKFLTDEQVGIYMRLLIAQFQHGRLNEKQMRHICKTYDKDVYCKFDVDDAGLYYNERLEKEVDKRKKYSESRKLNRNRRKDTIHMSNISKSYVQHMENENENENVIVNTTSNIKKGKNKKILNLEITESSHPLRKLIRDNFSQISKLPEQLSDEQAEKLISEFGDKAVSEVLEQMENWVPLSKKSKSVFLTCKNWLRRRNQPTTTTTYAKPTKPTFTQAASDWLDSTSRGSVFTTPNT